MLFALQLYYGIDDIKTVAATALTDGPNDKKCDLVYVDKDRSVVVVAQGYYSDLAKPSASANKASDLNTAISWLLDGNVETMPTTLRSAALEVRAALEHDEVNSFELWYVHNLNESDNVKDEMERASGTAKRLIRDLHPDSQVVSITSREIGRTVLDDWYQRTEVPIAVTNEFEVPIYGGFEEASEKWTAFCGSISGTWLRDIWTAHSTDLFSPNVRDYLGVVKSEKNINNGIKTSVREDPDQFWIFNNGVTIIVNDFEWRPGDAGSPGALKVHGLGIVNGAQTTGTLGTLQDDEADKLEHVRVMARFVKCSDATILRDVVRFNNTQNKVEAADFRSNDNVQDRLRLEFSNIPEADYRGARRGGIRDAIERKKNLLPDNTVAQALAAFHGRPNLAYNDTRRIWLEDGVYAQHFSDNLSARHIVFCFSLLRSIEDAKAAISQIIEKDRTEAQKRHMEYFRRRGSLHLLASAISASIESVIGKAVVNKHALRFKENVSPRVGTDAWSPIVAVSLAFSSTLSNACDRDLQNSEKVRHAVSQFCALIEATVDSNRQLYKDFAETVEIAS